jgi:hypothetical protein
MAQSFDYGYIFRGLALGVLLMVLFGTFEMNTILGREAPCGDGSGSRACLPLIRNGLAEVCSKKEITTAVVPLTHPTSCGCTRKAHRSGNI